VDTAPHLVANSGITVSGLGGLFAFLGYQHISNYRLHAEIPTIRASGLDVLDFSMKQRIREWVDFNFSIDNLTNKRYFETQNFFQSRVRSAISFTIPTAASVSVYRGATELM
jgi:outer membrane receptor protein involved in Fe transport